MPPPSTHFGPQGDWAFARRIAIVMHDFSTGGSERIAIRLANAWAASGREVTVLCGTEAGPLRALLSPDVQVITERQEVRRSLLSRLWLGIALAHLVKVTKPDVIFAPGNFHIPVLVMMSAVLRGTAPPIVCKLSNPLVPASYGAFLRPLVTRLARWALQPIDALVTMSRGLAREAETTLTGKDCVTIYEPNITEDIVPAVRPLLGGTEIILCVGRLVHQKNFLLALAAFAEMPSAHNRRLVILGDGPQRLQLLRRAYRLGIAGRVEILGYVSDIKPWLNRANVLLCTSRYEGYPAVLIEALAAGLPVVTTDCSPALEDIMLDPSFGCVAAADPAALAFAMGNALTGKGPNPLARAMLVQRHDVGEAARRYLKLFDRVVRYDSRRPAPPQTQSVQS